MAAYTPNGDPDTLVSFASRIAEDVVEELTAAMDVPWRFYAEEPTRLADSGTRRPSEFLDQAIHRMVEGPYDLIIIVTDAPLISSRERLVPGLASPLGRTVVLSTDIMRRGVRDKPSVSLESETMRVNAATLVLHLIGHVLGARHRDADGGVMERYTFEVDREQIPEFTANAKRHLHQIAHTTPQEETPSRGFLRRVAFYLASAAKNPRQLFRAVIHSRAPLLPLSLPKLTTAAVAPTLIIVFSAEAWDVGFHMSNSTAVLFSGASIIAAAVYLLFAQNLWFPRQRHRRITEHTALVNVAVFCIMLLAMAGLFVFVGAIILLIELVVFPPNLMSSWPSLEDPIVGTVDLIRTGAFITTIGVLSGALAGGLESRTIIRHLTLFLDHP